MSDPVSSMDVEDVLSSIRRLVSEEAKSNPEPAHRAANTPARTPAKMAGSSAGDAADPLALRRSGSIGAEVEPQPPHFEAAMVAPKPLTENTPNMRGEFGVPPSNDFAPAAVIPAPVVSVSVPPLATEDGAQKLVLTAALRVPEKEELVFRSAQKQAAPSQSNLRREPLLGETEARPQAESPAGIIRRPMLQPVAVAAETTDDHIPAERGLEAAAVEAAAVEAAAVEAAAVEADRRPAPFQFASDDSLFERATRAMDALKQSEEAGSYGTSPKPNVPPAPMIEVAPETTAPTENLRKPRPSLRRAPEVKASTVEPATEPSSAPTRAPAEKPMSLRKPVPETEPSTFQFSEEEDVPEIDEDTLRDMISEMVREELQGELGDRITRNVRKLVRREIQRAMASREFE